ncbi:MAG: DUF268 domain-containing protein [Ruminococcus flavefaciens]|nr:DUF268 domain-containing protein [Ruminococcus flavefaciens]
MKIWIWGTGQVAKEVFESGVWESNTLKGFIETQKTKCIFEGYPVIDAKDIPSDFDYIFVANRFADEVYDWCVASKVDMQKVFFLIRGKKTNYLKPSKVLKEILGEKNVTNYQAQYEIFTETFVDDDMVLYKKLNKRKNFEIQKTYMWPIIGDKYAINGAMGNYFWQDLWAAKKIIKSGIKEHYDIGSRVDGFIAHLLAADIKVNVIDIRPFPTEVDNLYTIVDDATMLNQFEDNSIQSLSALCSLEHFGLGRYGDSIDPEACFKCFVQIQKKMKQGGNLFLSLPIGKERVEFNAHRVFYAETVQKNFSLMHLLEFSCAAEGKIEYNIDIHKYDTDKHHGDYRYGLFHFEKV